MAEVRPLIKLNRRREAICVVILLAIALYLAVSDALGLPGPIELLDTLLAPLGRQLFLNNQN